MTDELDRWLDGELSPLLAGTDAPPSPRYLAARARTPRWRLRLASLPAMLGTKLLVGAGAVALAGAGVGIKAAVTGSVNPLDWSHGAAPIVQTCMASASPGEGLGGCVSTGVAAGHPDATVRPDAGSRSRATAPPSGVPSGAGSESPNGSSGGAPIARPTPGHPGPATPNPASGQNGASGHASSGSGHSPSPSASDASATHH